MDIIAIKIPYTILLKLRNGKGGHPSPEYVTLVLETVRQKKRFLTSRVQASLQTTIRSFQKKK